MTRDRLRELQLASVVRQRCTLKNTGVKQEENHLEEFLRRIEELNELLHRAEGNLTKSKKLQRSLLKASTPSVQEENELKSLYSDTKHLCWLMRESIKDLNANMSQVSHVNVRKMQMGAFQKRLNEFYANFIDNYSRYHEDMDKRRRYILSFFGIDHQDGDELLDDLTLSGGIAQQHLLHQRKLAQAQVSQLQYRYEDLLKLEKTLAELADLFVETTDLLFEQQDKVDTLVWEVEGSTHRVQDAQVVLASSRKSRKKRIGKKLTAAITVGAGTAVATAVAAILLL